MNTYMDIEEIRDEYKRGGYRYSMSDIPVKIKDNYVFDENLTVKRNREMIAEYNQKIDDAIKECRDKNDALSRKLCNDVIGYISNTYNMTEHQARIIEAYVYVHKHSFMNEYFDAIDEVAEMVESVLSVKSE